MCFFSTNINDVNVTIAGSVCDVQSTSNTQIICVTNAQQQSQQTKVRVAIGNQGIALMVRAARRIPDRQASLEYQCILIQPLPLSSGQRRFLLHRRVVVPVHLGG